MTKSEAIQLMERGMKMSHRFFTPDEWVTIDGELMVTEDGVKQSQENFWLYRTDKSFETGWNVFIFESDISVKYHQDIGSNYYHKNDLGMIHWYIKNENGEDIGPLSLSKLFEKIFIDGYKQAIKDTSTI